MTDNNEDLGTIELRAGGQARLNFTDSGIVIDSTVTSFEPEQIIEYSWSGPGEPLRTLRGYTRGVQ